MAEKQQGSFKKRLAQMKKVWDGAKNRKGGFTKLPDGKYMAKLVDAALTESEKGDLYLRLKWTVTEGESEGQIVMDWNRIADEQGVFYAMEKLRKMNVEVPDDPSELEATCVQMSKDHPEARVTLKTKGDFQNLYVDRAVGGDEGDDADAEDAEEADDADDADADEDTDDADEPEADEPDEPPEGAEGGPDDEIEVKVGQAVEVEGKGEGEITRVDEEHGLIHVRLSPSGKKAVVTADVLTIIKGLTAAKKPTKAKSA